MGQSEVLLFGGNVHVKPDEKKRVETADLQILSWGRWALIAKGLQIVRCMYVAMHDDKVPARLLVRIYTILLNMPWETYI